MTNQPQIPETSANGRAALHAVIARTAEAWRELASASSPIPDDLRADYVVLARLYELFLMTRSNKYFTRHQPPRPHA